MTVLKKILLLRRRARDDGGGVGRRGVERETKILYVVARSRKQLFRASCMGPAQRHHYKVYLLPPRAVSEICDSGQ